MQGIKIFKPVWFKDHVSTSFWYKAGRFVLSQYTAQLSNQQIYISGGAEVL